MNRHDVLIIGAGPTGLVLALWLTRQGIRVRIVDRTALPGTTSRALAVHARTLELYRQLDLADAVIARGHKVPAVNLWVQGHKKARVSFEDIGTGLTPYPFLHIFPQDEHERLLIERLEAMGVRVERQTELVDYRDDGDHVVATLRGPAGEQSCEAAYIAGCDGARSAVRQGMDAAFPGGTYQQLFYVADVAASGPPIDGELHVDLDDADFLAIFALADTGRARLIGTVRDERAEQAETLRFEDVSNRAITHLKVEVEQVNWFSTYHVHHRVADRFRQGRAFLLGDAAHIHSPAGGQGMNTGIGDAINLAWKLAAVLGGRAGDALLDSYQAERIAFARRLVSTTDRAFTMATAEGRLAKIVRTRLFPLAFPAAAHFQSFREWMFRTVSQIMIHYRDCPLNAGQAGEVHGGDRMPWIDERHAAPLAGMVWQVLLHGEAKPELAAWCRENGVPLHVFPWKPALEDAGLAENAAYLIRPDSYVAFADPSGDPVALNRFFADRALRP